MNKEKVLSWREVVNLVSPQVKKYPKGLSSFINTARIYGIGKQVSNQKTKYSDEDLDKLRILINWWVYLNEVSNNEWRNERISNLIQERIINSILNNKTIIFYSIFCPSYKLGKSAYGYSENIGEHTKKQINFFCNFLIDSKKIGLSVEGKIYFSDLILENYYKLQGTNYKNDLSKNYESFLTESSSKSKGITKTNLLSSIDECKLVLGEMGPKDEVFIPEHIYDLILKRNKIFYSRELEWTDKMVADRTKVLISSYSKLKNIFNKIYPESIMIWSESSLERGLLYHFDPSDSIPVIYPKKND